MQDLSPHREDLEPIEMAPVDELRALLAVHETAEEEIVHPVARRTLANGDAVVRMRLHEENEAKKVLGELEKLDVGSSEFEAKLTQLRDAVLAHAESEEKEEFDKLGQELEPKELQRMRKAAELAEAVAPTRPHAGVESQAATVTEAFNANSQRVAAVLDALKQQGVAAEDLQTSNLDVSSVASDTGRPVGFRVSNLVTVRRRDVASAASLLQAQSVSPVRLGELTTEHETNPIGIGEAQPRLSWKLHSDRAGEAQTAYQIRAATTGAHAGQERHGQGDAA